MGLTSQDVHEILGLLDAAGYDELDLRTERYTLTLRRDESGWTQETDVTAPPTLVARELAAPASPSVASRSHPGDDVAVEGLHDVRAPLPGTFYRAPKPGDPPFVEVGSRVDAHSVVGLIETMKLFNSVSAGASGVVREILVANGELAHHHALLMRIEPDGT